MQHKCMKEERFDELDKQINKLKLQYNTSLILLNSINKTVDKIDKNQKIALKVILTSLTSLVFILLKLLLT